MRGSARSSQVPKVQETILLKQVPRVEAIPFFPIRLAEFWRREFFCLFTFPFRICGVVRWPDEAAESGGANLLFFVFSFFYVVVAGGRNETGRVGWRFSVFRVLFLYTRLSPVEQMKP